MAFSPYQAFHCFGELLVSPVPVSCEATWASPALMTNEKSYLICEYPSQIEYELMRHRLPPLNALPSFEAAARHLSFSRAADELHVTHSAISRAVRNLEDHLGVQLMVRATRSVRLTPIGASFAAEIRDVLEHLAAATSAATGQSSRIVSISTIDSFAARWLMPRLFRFRHTHGDIDVRVATSERLADFISDGIDIAVRCGGGRYPGLSAELLMKEDHFPVCSPKLLEGRNPLRVRQAKLARSSRWKTGAGKG